MSKSFLAVFSFVILLMTMPAALYSQGSDLGQIRGTVTDASEAAVPNAGITITDVATSASRTGVANGRANLR